MVKSNRACKSRSSVVKLEDMSIRAYRSSCLSSGNSGELCICPRHMTRSVFLYVRIERTYAVYVVSTRLSVY